MQYRINPKNGDRISLLGMGCMRFPRSGGKVDQTKADELIEAAIRGGINYFDTAYIYPGSEEALGRALNKLGERDKVLIATKLPHYTCKKPEDFDRIFETQLVRLQSDWIDYYHIHMLTNRESWERIKSLGIVDWIEKKRAEGAIKNLGFSFHGGRDDFIGLLDAYCWDFCLVQYNYYDEHNQAGITGIRAAHNEGLPVFVMGPVRGGILSEDLPEEAKEAFRKLDGTESIKGTPGRRSPANWALRWVFNHQEVTMALSGLSDLSQVADNTEATNGALPGALDEIELAAFAEAVSALRKTDRIPCTKCGYCMPCPMGVDIPECFSCYNVSYITGLVSGIAQYTQVTGQSSPLQSDASKCSACGKCEATCPQSIPIAKSLTKVRRRMKTFLIKPLFIVIRKLWRIN